jgi:hypothetical protein
MDQLAAAEYVYIRRSGVAGLLQPQYEGPFRVLQRGSKVFRVQVGDREEDISVDRLKPHLGATPAAVAEPPRRGRAARDGWLIHPPSPLVGGGLGGGHVAARKSGKRICE